MEIKNRYASCEVNGKGKIHLHTGDRGFKFEVLELSAEAMKIKASIEVNIGDIVSLKIQLDAGLYQVIINAIGKVINRSSLYNEYVYLIEFIGMSENDKNEIDQMMQRTCKVDYYD